MPDKPSRDGQEAEAPETPEAEAPEDGLTDFWNDVLGPRPESIRDKLVRELGGAAHPGVLTFATNTGRILVQIDPNGKVTLGEGVTADEAAEEFWTAMALKRRGMEERLLHLGMMESMLLRVARADVAYERAQLRARSDAGTEEDKYREELQRRNLEAIVHQVLEFSRGLLARPDAPPESNPAEPVRH